MKKLMCFIIGCVLSVAAIARNNYSSVDAYALQAPILNKPEDLKSVVDFLCHRYKRDDEKARVLLSWIVHNIDYDHYKFQKVVQAAENPDAAQDIPQNDILETRLGIGSDIAELYQKMGTLAGLEVQVVSGKTMHPSRTLEEYQTVAANHTWNVVKIKGQWEYVDPTWAISGDDGYNLEDVIRPRDYEKIIARREKRHSAIKKARTGRIVSDEWFLTDKDEMIKTHFPDDKKWQLQDKKLTEEEFLKKSNPRAYRALTRKKRREE